MNFVKCGIISWSNDYINMNIIGKIYPYHLNNKKFDFINYMWKYYLGFPHRMRVMERKNLTIVQGNELLEGAYSVTLDEMRLLNLALAQIDSKKPQPETLYESSSSPESVR